MAHVSAGRLTRWMIKVAAAVVLVQWLTGPVMIARADEPQPDPAGIATGDKGVTSDAGGNSHCDQSRRNGEGNATKNLQNSRGSWGLRPEYP
jgi:hypothetical protein